MRRTTILSVGLCLILAISVEALPIRASRLKPCPCPCQGAGYLDQPAFALDWQKRGPSTVYVPQPGDVMFSTTNIIVYRLGHYATGAGEPTHSALVYRRRDGQTAILEAGPFDGLRIETLDLPSHLKAYEGRGRVWIRPRSVPLTEEQSWRLTEFAEKQVGKRFALLRLWAQVTPFRARGPIRTAILGKPHGPDRSSFYCAELCIEAFVAAGALDPACARPSATYPSDFFFDTSRNPWLNANFKLGPNGWGVPSRWRSEPLLASPE